MTLNGMDTLWRHFVDGTHSWGTGFLLGAGASLLGIVAATGLIRPLAKLLSSKDPEKVARGRVRRLTFTFLVMSLALLPFVLYHATFAPAVRSSKILYEVAMFVLLSFGLYGILELLVALFADFLPQVRGRSAVSPITKDILRTVLIVSIFFVSARLAFPGADIGALVTTSAVFSLVVGLALQESLSNIFSGIMLSIDRPYKPGDWIRVEGLEGQVLESNWRSTRILTREDNVITVPNSTMAKSVLVNFSAPTPQNLVKLSVGLDYAAPPNKVRQVLVSMMSQVEGVEKDPPPDVFLKEFGDSAILYDLRFWIDETSARSRIEADILQGAWYHLKRNGLHIPFPIRTVLLKREREGRSIDEILGLLGRVDVLIPLKDAERHLLADGLSEQLFGEGETICKQGEEGQTFYIVKSGTIAVHIRGAEGVEAKVAELKTGDYFGEMSLLTGEPRGATCIAQEDTEVLCLDRDSFGVLIQQNPDVAQAMSEILAARMSVTQRRLVEERDTAMRRREKPDEAITKGILAKMLAIFRFKR